jgi:hypothetical protein
MRRMARVSVACRRLMTIPGVGQLTVRRLNLREGRPEILSPQGLLVRADIAKQQVPRVPTAPSCPVPGGDGSPGPAGPAPGAPGPSPTPPTPIKPRRFYGSVEIDINRPVKAFDTILNSVVMELQRSPGAKVKLTLEIEAEAPSGFNDADACVVHHNTKQLKFTPGSTGFSD